MKLFTVPKIGCFLDGITHSLETRRDVEVKILTLTLRVAPFTTSHAAAMADGVKSTLFKLNSGEPKDTLRRVDFALGVPRQILRIAAAPDAEAKVALDQVKIGGLYARASKDHNGYELVFRASFGPAGRRELEFVQDWLLTQRFVGFEEAEPGMFDEAAPAHDEPAVDEDQPDLPEHEFETDAEGAPVEVAADEAEPARTLPRRHRDRKQAAKAQQTRGSR